MEKRAKTSIEINGIIAGRWSPRAFNDTPIEIEKIQRLFEAARWTPSGFNEQPWRFIIGIKNKGESYFKILESLVQFNKDWASLAPALIVALSKKTYSQTGKANQTNAYDTGQAVAYLTLQASADGLHLHQMGGYDKEKIIELFDIPDDHEPQAIIAVGYKGEPDLLPDDIKKGEFSERTRKPISELVFEEKFDKSSSLFK